MGLANSLALKIAGISNRTSDPVGGTIMKNLDGGKYETFSSLRVC